ncbi:MAG: hypothetical protein KBE09_01220 [Candidatus Pacebacteria bacterium]|nr:hypothetical protein [Candidatus Paceibacterota bacterium]
MRKHFMNPALLAVAALFSPVLASAAGLADTLNLVQGFLSALVPMIITIAIIVFFWGLVKYLMEVGDKKSEGLQIMMYGIIALFVMVSIWGIIKLLQATFKVGDTNPIVPKAIQISDTLRR